MGMFTKDRQFGGLRLDEAFTVGNGDARGPDGGEVFCLLDIMVDPEPVIIPGNDLGPATKTNMRVCRWNDDKHVLTGTVFDVSTLSSAIAGKAAEKEDGDLPALVKVHTVLSKKYDREALVLTFVAPYDGPEVKFNTFAQNEYVPTDDPVAKGKASK